MSGGDLIEGRQWFSRSIVVLTTVDIKIQWRERLIEEFSSDITRRSVEERFGFTLVDLGAEARDLFVNGGVDPPRMSPNPLLGGGISIDVDERYESLRVMAYATDNEIPTNKSTRIAITKIDPTTLPPEEVISRLASLARDEFMTAVSMVLAQRAETRRSDHVTIDTALAVAADFEYPLGGFTRLSHDLVDRSDQEFLLNTVRQIELWSKTNGADPRIFELHIRAMTQRFVERLRDTSRLADALRSHGADDQLASHVAEAVSASISELVLIGTGDPQMDAVTIETLALRADQLEARLDAAVANGLVHAAESTNGEESKSKIFRAAVVAGAGTELTKHSIKGIGWLVGEVAPDLWTDISIGLTLAARGLRRFVGAD